MQQKLVPALFPAVCFFIRKKGRETVLTNFIPAWPVAFACLLPLPAAYRFLTHDLPPIPSGDLGFGPSYSFNVLGSHLPIVQAVVLIGVITIALIFSKRRITRLIHGMTYGNVLSTIAAILGIMAYLGILEQLFGALELDVYVGDSLILLTLRIRGQVKQTGVSL